MAGRTFLENPSSYTRNVHLSVHDGRFHEVTLNESSKRVLQKH